LQLLRQHRHQLLQQAAAASSSQEAAAGGVAAGGAGAYALLPRPAQAMQMHMPASLVVQQRVPGAAATIEVLEIDSD
jgi:hypothetical protein